MHDQLCFHVGSTSEAAARFYFSVRDGSKIVSASGKCSGPYCKFAKTLPAEFTMHLTEHPGTQQQVLEAVVIDPCYWGTTLSFTYQVSLQLELVSGEEISYEGAISMRQWHAEKQSLYLNQRRVVLRGFQGQGDVETEIQRCRETETCLLTNPLQHSEYQFSNEQGVGLVVDIRRVEDPLFDIVHQLQWSPSVLVVLLSGQQLSQLSKLSLPTQCLLAQMISVDSQPIEIANAAADLLAIELGEGERPPQWVADINLPLIVIGRGHMAKQLEEPRQACDLFQKNLAPEFNLAGYLVSQ